MGAPFRLFLVTAALLSAAVAQPPIHTLAGAAQGERLGQSVSGAGDVDGDGFADVIVGVPLADPHGVDSGGAIVLSGADGTLVHAFWGVAAGDQFGLSVSVAGDVDGDGFDDVIVGAPRDDIAAANAGSARVLSGADGSTLHLFLGTRLGDQLGWSVSGAGDVDGDGFADLVVGAPLDDSNGVDSGMARVFSGASGAVLYSALGDAPGDRLGWSVSGAGDVDADGRDDVVVGMPRDDNNGAESGAVRALSGAMGLALWTVDGAMGNDSFGWSVSCAGDVNGDGFADVIAGAPWNDTTGADAGAARVLSGVNGWVIRTLNGDRAGDLLGWAVAGCGDVDGDGTADVITGSPRHDSGGTDTGRASVWSGATGQRLWVLEGEASQDQFGTAVGIAGDVRQDGYAGVIIGAPLADENGSESGSAAVFARKPYDAQVEVLTHRPAPLGSGFGSAIQCVGDVDNDGVADYAVGAEQDAALFGTVRVYSGASHTVLHLLTGGSASVYFGHSIGWAGDVDGDGHGDFLTGAQHFTASFLQEGKATLWSGRTGGILKEWVGVQTSAHMGAALGGLGDIDGDGFGDVFVGVPRQNSNTGEVCVYSSRTGLMIYSVPGSQPGDEFGNSGGTVGDVDGDGFLDFVIGAPETLHSPAGYGHAVVLSGVNGRQLWRFDGLGPADAFGFVCAGAGDVDGDGTGDIIAGAHNHDPQGLIDAGMARVFSGATGSLLYHCQGASTRDVFGSAVSAAGDANADGYADFLIGAPGESVGGVFTAAGAAYLYSGADGSILQKFEGSNLLQRLGSGVAGLPDITGDGFADVVIGVPGDNGSGIGAGAAIVYNSASKTEPGSFRRYGAGCVSSSGKLPRIGLGGRPVLTRTFDVTVAAAPATAAAWLALDGARQNVSLGFLGAPSCTFLAFPVIVLPTATDPLGKAQLSLAVPYQSSLVGVELYLQWILSDALGGPLPFVLSQGGWVTIGAP